MCSSMTGACIDRQDCNVKRAPGFGAHEVPKKPDTEPKVPVQVCDMSKDRGKVWASQYLQRPSV